MKCPTCYEPLISDSKNYIVTTPCGHLFHTNCVQSWIATGNQTCPQCRSNISKDKLLRIYLPSNGSDLQLSQETYEDQQTSENTFHQHLSSNAVAYSSQGNSISLNYPSNSAGAENELSNQGTTRTNNTRTTAVQSNVATVPINTRASNQKVNDSWCSGQPCGVYVLYCMSFSALVLFVLILVHFGISRSKEKVSFKN
jgi:hypothetical protein